MDRGITDLEYIEHMIPHHQLAIDMSEIVMPKTTLPNILSICRDIIRDQRYEIWEMENLKGLISEDHNIRNHNLGHHDNMVHNDNMSETEYLEHMIPHHQIAIDMSEKLLLYTQNSYLIYLATKIIFQQKKEIMIMTGLLDKHAYSYHSELLGAKI